MAEKQLRESRKPDAAKSWRPAECDAVQPPERPPNPLLDQYLTMMKDPSSSITHGSNRLDVKGADGTQLSATFNKDNLEKNPEYISSKSPNRQFERFSNDGKLLESNWDVHRESGSLKMKAMFNPTNGSMRSQEGSVRDANGNRLQDFYYNFNPDGKVTLCAKANPNIGKQSMADMEVVWTAKP